MLLRWEMVAGWQDSDEPDASKLSCRAATCRASKLVLAGKGGIGYSPKLERQLVERLQKSNGRIRLLTRCRATIRAAGGGEIAYDNSICDQVMRKPKLLGWARMGRRGR